MSTTSFKYIAICLGECQPRVMRPYKYCPGDFLVFPTRSALQRPTSKPSHEISLSGGDAKLACFADEVESTVEKPAEIGDSDADADQLHVWTLRCPFLGK